VDSLQCCVKKGIAMPAADSRQNVVAHERAERWRVWRDVPQAEGTAPVWHRWELSLFCRSLRTVSKTGRFVRSFQGMLKQM